KPLYLSIVGSLKSVRPVCQSAVYHSTVQRFNGLTVQRFIHLTSLTPPHFVWYQPPTTASGSWVVLCVALNAVGWMIKLLIRALLAKGPSSAVAGNASIAAIASPPTRKSSTKV